MPLVAQNPGRFDRRITLRYPVATRTDDGGEAVTWYQGARVWGQWLSTTSREFYAAQAKHAETTGVLRIRYRDDITATWRFRLGDDLYELAGDPIEVGRKNYLDLPVRAIDQTPGTNLIALVTVALRAAFTAVATAIKGAVTNASLAATASMTATPVKDAVTTPAGLSATADMTGAAIKGAAASATLDATAAMAVAQRGVSNQLISSASARIVTSSGDVVVTYQYA